jgi:mannose-6-phosphate isomerase-like protein (cupin superfamily)
MIASTKTVSPTPLNAVRGGVGTLLQHILVKETPGSSIRAVVINRLPPGCTVGLHSHHGEEDFYYCLSGEGVVVDNGTEHPFVPGVLQITRDGESQAVRNTGQQDLVLLAALVATP